MQKTKLMRVTRRGTYTSKTTVISFKLPVAIVNELDRLIDEGFFQNRSDALREAVRRLISEYKGRRPKEFMVGL